MGTALESMVDKGDRVPTTIRWQQQTSLKTLFLYSLYDFKNLKALAYDLIPASLCEGPLFNFYVESVNLFPSISSKHLSCCDSIIYMLIFAIMSFMFPCLAQRFYLNEYNFGSYQWL